MCQVFFKGQCSLMRCVIISNGDILDYNYIKSLISQEDFVIATDGALRHCDSMGIIPDIWIGDNDSGNLSQVQLDALAKTTQVIRLDPIKDATDTEVACNYALAKAFDEVIMLGSCGSRLDHTLANVYLLKRFAHNGIKARIVNENNIIYMSQRHNIIEKSDYNNVSLLPIENNLPSVSNTGFYYSLDNEPLDMYSSRGVSNYLVEDVGKITVDGGTALIILSRD